MNSVELNFRGSKINVIISNLSVTFLSEIRIYSMWGVDVVRDLMEKSYTEYYKELYLYAWSLCRDHHLAQDLTSDTFFKAYLSLEGSEMHIKFWLFRVCKNLYIDFKRKEKEYPVDTPLGYLAKVEETPLQKLLDSEAKMDVFKGISELKESYREILILYYFCGFSIQEISGTIGLADGAVKTLLFRARRKLRIIMEGNNEF